MLMIGLIAGGVLLAVGLIAFLIIRRKIRKANGTPVWHLVKKNGTRWY